LTEPLGPRRKLIKAVLDLISIVADNVYFFFRIGCFTFNSKEHDLFISRLGTVPTIINYVLDIYLAYYDSLKESGGDKKLLKSLLLKKRLLFLSKLAEFPMQFYYLSVAWAQVRRGDAAAIGVISPLIFMLKHFNIIDD
jgi:hypothetical protein